MRPVLFHLPDALPWLGGAPVFSYGALLGLAYVLGWGVALTALAPDQRRPAALAYLVAGLVGWLGARLLGPWLDHSADPLVGGTLWPGILVGAGALVGAARLFGVSWRGALDAAALGTAFGVSVGRVGCYLHGCDYGVASDAGWAVRWPSWSGDFGAERPPGALVDRLPVQLLEAGLALGLALYLLLRLAAHGSRPRREGEVALRFFAGYAAIRLVLEPLRGDGDRGLDAAGSGLSTAQLTSAGVLVVLAVLTGVVAVRADRAGTPSTGQRPPR